MTDVEETLTRTLASAAGRAPHAPGTLAHRVESRYRRRAQRRRAVLAAAAVVVLTGSASYALRDDNTSVVPAASATQPSVPVRPTALPDPAGTVWPEAVRKLPAKLPDGRPFGVIGFLDDGTLLVTTAASFDKADAIYAYDLDAGEPRKIVDVPTPEGTVMFASGFTVGGDRVVWWTKLDDGKGQIWSASIAGGEAELVATQQVDGGGHEGGFDGLAVAGGKIVFSLLVGGVFTVPLEGGPVEPVQGGAGMHLLSWPWIGAAGPYGPTEQPRFGTIRNVETGETDTAVTRTGEKQIACGLTICTGQALGGESFQRLRDGSQQKPYPCSLGPAGAGRFCTTAVSVKDKGILGVVLHDLTTGRSADLGIQADGNRISLPQPEREMLTYTVGDERYLIDFTKIR
ncbi:hypothetical protein [Nonomuraea sp. LPB2021202275-12-8]|uniref:hypothetical protein n=1 Tax=Nonomuraea sp. LPB2021202275-12-8 TaxID=3120159 RepID=UPI00300D547E